MKAQQIFQRTCYETDLHFSTTAADKGKDVFCVRTHINIAHFVCELLLPCSIIRSVIKYFSTFFLQEFVRYSALPLPSAEIGHRPREIPSWHGSSARIVTTEQTWLPTGSPTSASAAFFQAGTIQICVTGTSASLLPVDEQMPRTDAWFLVWTWK